MFAFLAAAVASCDIEDRWNAMINGDPTQGTEPMESAELGWYSVEDQADIDDALNSGRSVRYDHYTLLPYTSVEKLDEYIEQGIISITEEDKALVNTMDFDRTDYLVRMSYDPFVAKVSKVTLTSSNEDIVSFEDTDDILNKRMTVKQVGECDVTMVAEGVNTIERTYHLRIVGRIAIMIYTDPFWLHNLTARLKYKTKQLPPGVKKLYMNVRDSVSVVGMCRLIDQRKGEKTFKSVASDITFPLKQHTDKFRKGKRVILRNVSDAVYHFNEVKTGYSYMLVPDELKDAVKVGENILSVKFSITQKGGAYYMTILGQEIPIDKYQLEWINRQVKENGKWPNNAKVVEENGVKYIRFEDSYVCKQLRLAIDILGDNPYLIFDIMTKANQTPSNSDEDEDDPDEEFVNGAEEVVDSLGTQLKDYFTFTFVENMSQHVKDSLARELNRMIQEVPDSTKWVFDIDLN